MVAHRTWTDEQLAEAVANSVTATGLLRKLGLKNAGNTQRHIFRHVKRLQLDTSHFKGQGWAKGSTKDPEQIKASLLPLLRANVTVAKLRDRLIASGLKKKQCEECGIAEWQGRPAPLQVDHVDGDRLNNELENLRILCANCHMLTETWGFKNSRRRPQALVA